MAMSYCRVGRAASASPLFRLRLLSFSTDNADKVCLERCRSAEDRGSYHHIGDKIHTEIASYYNEVAPVPSGFPFDLKAPPGSPILLMERRYHKETITVDAPLDIENPDNGDGPFLPMTVKLRKGTSDVMSQMTLKPGQLHIHKVIVRNSDTDMTDVREYFKSVGITSKTISFLYDRLGYNRKTA